MIAVPETRYVTKGDGTQIAYQTLGDGPLDLVYSAGGLLPIDLVWDAPPAARFLNRLASFARLVLFDPTGWGASSLGPRVAALEDFADDLMTVANRVGLVRPAVVGWAEGAFLALYAVATHPENFSALVLINSYARFLKDADYPDGLPSTLLQEWTAFVTDRWGTGEHLRVLAPSVADDEPTRKWLGRCERLASAPRDIQASWADLARRDLRSVLPSIRLPTLILHRRDDQQVRIGHGRYLAEHIPGAVFIELDGSDHLPFVFRPESSDILDHAEKFLTGQLKWGADDRVLATIVFTDIVQSTQHAVTLGDRSWRDVLAQYDEVARHEIDAFRGKAVKGTGDGTLAIFDGPARAIRCSKAIEERSRHLGLQIRTGVHTGEIERHGDDIAGIAVHVAARICQSAGGGEVLVSRTVTDLVAGSGIAFEERGDHELKGVPGTWTLFAAL